MSKLFFINFSALVRGSRTIHHIFIDVILVREPRTKAELCRLWGEKAAALTGGCSWLANLGDTHSGEKIFLIMNYFLKRLRIKGSPGANTLILSGLVTTAYSFLGSPLNGEKSGESTEPQ